MIAKRLRGGYVQSPSLIKLILVNKHLARFNIDSLSNKLSFVKLILEI